MTKLEKGACFTKANQQRICPSVMPRNKPKCNSNEPRCAERIRKYKKQLAKDRADYKPIPKSKWKPIGRPPKPETEKNNKIKEEYKEKVKDIKTEGQKRFGYSKSKQMIRKRAEWEAKQKKKFREQHKSAFPKAPPRKNQKKVIKKKPKSQPKEETKPQIKKQTGSFTLSFK